MCKTVLNDTKYAALPEFITNGSKYPVYSFKGALWHDGLVSVL